MQVRQRSYTNLTRSEGMVDWAGDPPLPCEYGAAQAHIVRGVSDAELGQKQQPIRFLHLRLSARHRPSARRGDRGTPREGYLRPSMFYPSQEAPDPEFIDGLEGKAKTV